jgi:hypothetical protein
MNDNPPGPPLGPPGVKWLPYGGEGWVRRTWQKAIHGTDPERPRRIGSLVSLVRLSITDRSWMRKDR